MGVVKITDIVNVIKAQIIKWLGHISRGDSENVPKNILEWKPMEERLKGNQRYAGECSKGKPRQNGNEKLE